MSAFQSLYGGQFTLSTPLINQIFVYHSPTDAAPQFLQKLIPFTHKFHGRLIPTKHRRIGQSKSSILRRAKKTPRYSKNEQIVSESYTERKETQELLRAQPETPKLRDDYTRNKSIRYQSSVRLAEGRGDVNQSISP